MILFPSSRIGRIVKISGGIGSSLRPQSELEVAEDAGETSMVPIDARSIGFSGNQVDLELMALFCENSAPIYTAP